MMTPVKAFATTLLLFSSLFSLFLLSGASDAITAAQFIKDGDTMASAGSRFELGFFSPPNSSNRYVGIWFKEVSPTTAVWVANRDAPLPDKSGVLKLTAQGILVILNRTNHVIWSSSNSSTPLHRPIAQLLNSGNFIVKDENDEDPDSFSWQSFDHPGDTFLAGMKLGVNRITGTQWLLSSWKSSDDPAPGDYTVGVDTHRFFQIFLSKNSVLQSTSGPWNGVGFSGVPGYKANPYFKFDFVNNQKEAYVTYELKDSSLISRLVLNSFGTVQRQVWQGARGWATFISVPIENCFLYAKCGTFSFCNLNNLPVCECLKGFEPKFPKEWEMADWSGGCVRRTPLGCGDGDWFFKYSEVKPPDTRDYRYNGNMSRDECETACLNDCNCTAYAIPGVTNGGRGCLIWLGALVDIRQSSDNGQEVRIRMAASERDETDGVTNSNESRQKKKVKILVSSLGVSMVVLLLCLLLAFHICRQKQQKQVHGMTENNLEFRGVASREQTLELPFFELVRIARATDDFASYNKIGEGGFGSVYKGVLEDGQEIAVKRMSKDSKQGLDEFKNEVIYIAKLQHRNLVRLLGCCIEGDENLLVYEYMSNNSLDYFIFDKTKSMTLDWPMRFCIINGVARGLLYLHQDSRLRIIHRDLKAGNILLDKEMNPKISDFGMARCFGGNDTEGTTKRVVGTYGYMPPEYAIDGQYSIKSDVFSFGVLVMEIVSGKRNRGFNHPNHNLNLIGHAWKLLVEGRSMELLDPSLKGSHNVSEVLRSIHLSLLCVQRHPEDRPTMSNVVQMLSGDSELPMPKQPGFFSERDLAGSKSSSAPYSANEVTVSLLQPR